jgi:hypothetical protein
VGDGQGSDAPLHAAARGGDAGAVERLLDSGAAIDDADAHGRTALHHAVIGGHAHTAAVLLAHGADARRVDRDGRAALDPTALRAETLHAIRQHYHRFRGVAARERLAAGVEAWSAELERRGIIKLPGVIGADELEVLRREFEGFVLGLRRRLARGEGAKRHYFEEEHWWAAERALVSNNAFKHSPQLLRFACRSDILALARRYLGGAPIIQRALAMRYLGAEVAERDMFTWHHDLEDRRLKVMILLSPVGPDDQHLSYVCGSQALFHPYDMFLRNDCGLDYCHARLGELEIYDAVGAAGDVFIFDSNGAHRGTRRAGARVRDVFLLELNASAANLWGGDADPGVLAELEPLPTALTRLLAAEKKWAAPNPELPSWVATLPDLRRWL